MNYSLELTIISRTLKLASFIFAFAVLTSCSNDDDVFADVSVNGTVLASSTSSFVVGDESDFDGDIDGSFTGNGGSATRVFSWNNNLTTADFNADITATTDGSFQMIVRDSEEIIVLDRTIQGGTEPDSIDGVTQSGASGIWTVTIVVTNFSGDGSFSLSEGN
ncbi:hypothetical protein MAR621_03848 [Maribacter dokdonensis]|uniref:hypothetical protein n=1 Tax=Maribacter dokdonensis TaxID=320912 RepID=UPI001B1F95A6|nr:hypothetical protein [Maribacter dokdonensis]CAG2533802.1 hypothetical protein MAR621_03848 [Maribacter dokdonensis]